MDYFQLSLAGLGGYYVGLVVQHLTEINTPKRVDKRHAIHPVKNEEDALEKLKDAYSKMNITPREFIKFNKDSNLVQKIEKTNWIGKKKIVEEVNNYVTLLTLVNNPALKIKVFEDKDRKKPIYEGIEINNYFLSLPKN